MTDVVVDKKRLVSTHDDKIAQRLVLREVKCEPRLYVLMIDDHSVEFQGKTEC